MKTDETRVYLWFTNYGDDAAIVTRAIGLQPTLVCVPGKTHALFPKMTYKAHKWELSSPLGLSAHIDEHFEVLLRLIESHAEAIRVATQLWTGGINAAVYYQNWTPGIHFSAALLKIAARMNLSIDLDLYFLGDTNA